MLLKYLDIVRIPLPKTAKTGTLNKKNVNGVAPKQVRGHWSLVNVGWGERRQEIPLMLYRMRLRIRNCERNRLWLHWLCKVIIYK